MDVTSMGILPMHEGKMPLKCWGMLPSLSGPLGLGQVVDTMVGGSTLQKGGHVGISKIYIGISSISLGRPHYTPPPPPHPPLPTP